MQLFEKAVKETFKLSPDAGIRVRPDAVEVISNFVCCRYRLPQPARVPEEGVVIGDSRFARVLSLVPNAEISFDEAGVGVVVKKGGLEVFFPCTPEVLYGEAGEVIETGQMRKLPDPFGKERDIFLDGATEIANVAPVIAEFANRLPYIDRGIINPSLVGQVGNEVFLCSMNIFASTQVGVNANFAIHPRLGRLLEKARATYLKEGAFLATLHEEVEFIVALVENEVLESVVQEEELKHVPRDKIEFVFTRELKRFLALFKDDVHVLTADGGIVYVQDKDKRFKYEAGSTTGDGEWRLSLDGGFVPLLGVLEELTFDPFNATLKGMLTLLAWDEAEATVLLKGVLF